MNEDPTEQSSRRDFIRGAIFYAIAVGAGVSACGGGGGGGSSGGFAGAVVPTPAPTSTPAPAPATSGGGTSPDQGVTPFQHGVASGDPLPDRVVLWTRVSVSAPGNLSLNWDVAADPNFGAIMARGTVTTGPEQDYTAKVDVKGLQPASVYYYRFYRGSDPSPVGRTRTLPTGAVSQVKIAVLSCANFPAGYFNVYADVAARKDIDLALHLGDYIYEYGLVGYASQLAFAIDRQSEPPHEILTLDDYRRRHAQYRTDKDLQAFHAAVPVIAVWDDHDLANNAWSGGAAEHDPATEGSFEARRSAAVQAYHEWLPTRLPDPANPLKIYRSFDLGNLASLHMLDTRLIARDQQQTLAQYLNGEAAGASRQLLGSEQNDWLAGKMAASGATWQVLGQQVLMARMLIPLSVAASFTTQTLGEYVLAQSTPEALRSDSQRALLAQQRVPYNLDAWDGYPAAREKVLAMARTMGKNLVSLAGDTHNAWASNLVDASGQRVGVEFATASVSSPGFERLLPLIASSVLADGFLRMVQDLRYSETSQRGYVVLTLTPSEARCDWIEIGTVFSHDYTATLAKSLRALPGPGKLEVIPA